MWSVIGCRSVNQALYLNRVFCQYILSEHFERRLDLFNKWLVNFTAQSNSENGFPNTIRSAHTQKCTPAFKCSKREWTSAETWRHSLFVKHTRKSIVAADAFSGGKQSLPGQQPSSCVTIVQAENGKCQLMACGCSIQHLHQVLLTTDMWTLFLWVQTLFPTWCL